jgi:hypothetical protein
VTSPADSNDHLKVDIQNGEASRLVKLHTFSGSGGSGGIRSEGPWADGMTHHHGEAAGWQDPSLRKAKMKKEEWLQIGGHHQL